VTRKIRGYVLLYHTSSFIIEPKFRNRKNLWLFSAFSLSIGETNKHESVKFASEAKRVRLIKRLLRNLGKIILRIFLAVKDFMSRSTSDKLPSNLLTIKCTWLGIITNSKTSSPMFFRQNSRLSKITSEYLDLVKTSIQPTK